MSGAAPEPEPARAKWNRRYGARPARPLADPPAEWLWENRSLVAGSPGRRALDVACGAGRNALFLAGLGFEVDAVDVSDVAVDRLRAAVRERSLSVDARRLDLERDPLPRSDYDLIVVTASHPRTSSASLCSAHGFSGSHSNASGRTWGIRT